MVKEKWKGPKAIISTANMLATIKEVSTRWVCRTMCTFPFMRNLWKFSITKLLKLHQTVTVCSFHDLFCKVFIPTRLLIECQSCLSKRAVYVMNTVSPCIILVLWNKLLRNNVL